MKKDENKIILNNEQQISGDEALVRLSANLLNKNAQHLNAVTLQKLATARNQAVSELASIQTGGINHNGAVLQWFGHSYLNQHKVMATALLLGAALFAFLVTQQFNNKYDATVGYQEDSDAFLLASELPPEAFADKGFDTWVVSKRD